MAHLDKIASKLTASVKPLDDLVGAGEAALLAIISRAASWGASIPNAIMVARSAEQIFGLTWGLSLGIAISLELIGHALVAHWQDTKSWNASKRQGDEPANTVLALGLMVGFWLVDIVMVGVLALSTFLSSGDWRIFIALCYPLIGIAVAIVTNERAHLFRVKQKAQRDRKDKAETRRKQRAERAAIKAEIAAKGTATRTPELAPIAVTATTESGTLERARYIYDTQPGISGSELGRKLGLSERQGRNLKAEMVSGNSGNGHTRTIRELEVKRQ